MKLEKRGHLNGDQVKKLKSEPTFWLYSYRDRFSYKGKLYKFWTVNLSAGFGTAYEEVELTYGEEFFNDDWNAVEELDEMLGHFLKNK